MNAINELVDSRECENVSSYETIEKKKINGLEIAFSMILFVTAICGVWKASSLVISIVMMMQ